MSIVTFCFIASFIASWLHIYILAKLCNNNTYHIVYCIYMEKTILLSWKTCVWSFCHYLDIKICLNLNKNLQLRHTRYTIACLLIYSFWLPFWYLQTFLASYSPERCHPIYFLLLKNLSFESCQQIYIKATTLTGNFLKAYSSKLNIYFRNCVKVTKVTGIIDSTSSCSHSKPHNHKTFENEIHTHTPKLANQNAVLDVLLVGVQNLYSKLL